MGTPLEYIRRLSRWARALMMLGVALVTGCSAPHGPPAGALQDVQSIEIRYQYSGWGRVDEVHRLEPGAGRRTFQRSSQLDSQEDPDAVLTDAIPAQRVAELLWAVSAPPWPRERGVDAVARRVRPARILEQALPDYSTPARGCTPRAFEAKLHALLQRASLKAQLGRYYANGIWTDDDPAMRVVIRYEHRAPQVLASNERTLLMLPWVLGDPGAGDAAVTTWSVPVSQALRRLLPESSKAFERLGRREDGMLVERIAATARVACEAQHR
ncbi:hypothetical protein [Stenotrophomonas rhizophila]|uniref:hypothetical protein n=1 Tax=Stenotrophomonas rhizophila TaxID=216778 RepID=UPI00112F63C0|nr:hypothetical protein [Stenotrophomonas rhizophila]